MSHRSAGSRVIYLPKCSSKIGRRAWGTLACSLVFLLAGQAQALAQTTIGPANNYIEASNSDPANPLIRTGTSVAFQTGTNAVSNENLAYAYSFNCTGCRTEAVAIQLVVVEGNPTSVAPQNAAVAVNDHCTGCQTFAYARQYLVYVHHPVQVSDEERAQLQRFGQRVDAIAYSGEDFATMSAQLDQLCAQYYAAINQAISGGQSPSMAQDHRAVEES